METREATSRNLSENESRQKIGTGSGCETFGFQMATAAKKKPRKERTEVPLEKKAEAIRPVENGEKARSFSMSVCGPRISNQRPRYTVYFYTDFGLNWR